MGWIAGKAYQIGAGTVKSPQRVLEPAGFEGELVTHYDTTTDGRRPQFRRHGRTVYATKREALENS